MYNVNMYMHIGTFKYACTDIFYVCLLCMNVGSYICLYTCVCIIKRVSFADEFV